MVETTYFGVYTIQLWEYLLLPIYLIFIYIIAARIKNRSIKKDPVYKYFLPGLFAKTVAGVILCLIYVYYYQGGDTITYYECGRAMVNLFFKDPLSFFTVLFGDNSQENRSLFDATTGYPVGYMYYDSQTFLVIRIISPLLLISFNSFIIATALLAALSYIGIWKLYLMFCEYYKPISFQLAIAVLFIPSVVFWGSGMLKDTITLSAAGWFVYSIYRVFIFKKGIPVYSIAMTLSAAVIVFIKPYILITLLPGALFWIFYQRISKVRNRLLLAIYIPVVYAISIGGGILILSKLGDSLSKFSLDKILDTAVITQQDLKQDYYGKNSFDIGTFDASFSGISAKAPLAIGAGLFRPFIWEAGNLVMILSGLENTFILGLTIFLMFKIKIFRLFRIIFHNPLLLFSLSYSILFSFAVGLTTSNFGALVRFKIAYLPFLVSSLFILNYFMQNKKIDFLK